MSARPPMPIILNGSLRLPWFRDHEAFRRWAREERPERGRFTYLGDTLWVDLTLEQADTHNAIKGEVASVLRSFARTAPKGHYCTDGMLITHVGAGLSTVPDGSFYLLSSEAAGRIVRVPNIRGIGCVELQGTLDMVLGVVSESSVEKDTVTMPALYHAAGVPEFWRVNALGGLHFEIFRRAEAAYEPTAVADGWYRSAVFGRDFRMTVETDEDGLPRYTLEHRPIA